MTIGSHTTRPRRGFTLVEILVVIGIVVILAGLLVPMVARSMRQAKQTRTAADMQSISTALEAFKMDHGDYPRTEAGTQNTGAAMLGRYLNGPLGDGVTPPAPAPTDPPTYDPAVDYGAGDPVLYSSNTYVSLAASSGVTPGSDVTKWAVCNNLTDFVDGPGIRMRAGGKKYGPYVTSEKMSMRGVVFVDGNGSPILYFPARPGAGGNLSAQDAYVNISSASPKSSMKYDANDNIEPFRRTTGETAADVLKRIRAYLGDYDGDGLIETNVGEKIITEAPYLLWAAGPDGRFGPDADAAPPVAMTSADIDRCDDVVNFK